MRYRRTVLLEEGRTERGGGGVFPRRLFAFSQGRSLFLSGHTRMLRTRGRARGGEGSPPPVRDPGRPIPRYGYDYEKYGNSALKDVKWPGGGGLYRHVGTRHLWRSINVMYARRFCPGIEIGWRGERYEGKVSPKGLDSRGAGWRFRLYTLCVVANKDGWIDR